MGPAGSVTASVLWFLAGAAVIAVAGTRMARYADHLAHRTALGQAVTGAVLLGVSTSLPGITASVTAALSGYPTLAVTNAMGGIAAQTAFLAVADAFHREANLEHAAASTTNLTFSALLVGLLAIVLLAISGPGWTIGHVDPASIALLVAYPFGLRLAMANHRDPMWRPRPTPATVRDEKPADDDGRTSRARLVLSFALAAAAVLVGGFVVARAAGALVETTGLSESLAGGFFTAVTTSLPELVTTIAAVRRGALTMAVSDIVGGNAFDVLFVAVADLAFLDGSIYAAVGPQAAFLAALAVLLNVVVLLGLLQRQPQGPGGIGFESVLVLVLYAGGLAMLALGP
jgi:cation:H+ antiporter